MHLNNIKNKKGLTLPELLVASLLSAIAIVAILGESGSISSLIEANREKTLACIHAQYVLEQIKDENFTGLETNIINGIWNLSTDDLAANPYNFAVLAQETITTSVVASGNPLHIRVDVSWQNRSDSTRNFAIETYRTD